MIEFTTDEKDAIANYVTAMLCRSTATLPPSLTLRDDWISQAITHYLEPVLNEKTSARVVSSLLPAAMQTGYDQDIENALAAQNASVSADAVLTPEVIEKIRHRVVNRLEYAPKRDAIKTTVTWEALEILKQHGSVESQVAGVGTPPPSRTSYKDSNPQELLKGDHLFDYVDGWVTQLSTSKQGLDLAYEEVELHKAEIARVLAQKEPAADTPSDVAPEAFHATLVARKPKKDAPSSALDPQKTARELVGTVGRYVDQLLDQQADSTRGR